VLHPDGYFSVFLWAFNVIEFESLCCLIAYRTPFIFQFIRAVSLNAMLNHVYESCFSYSIELRFSVYPFDG